jgi:putative endonuclease
MHSKLYYVYILTNKGNNVFYTGVTDNLVVRMHQHKQKFDPNSFTAKYNVNKLVFYENGVDALEAIHREKQIKGGSRKKKRELIERINPTYEDLFDQIK